MRVKFTERHQYETEGRNKGPIFEVDQIENFRDDLAERFIRRGVAVRIHDGGPVRSAPARTETVQVGSGGASRRTDGAKTVGKQDGGKS